MPHKSGFRLGIYIFKDAEVIDFAAPYGVFSIARSSCTDPIGSLPDRMSAMKLRGLAMKMIVSINVGSPRGVHQKGRIVRTGIFKAPVQGPVRVRRSSAAKARHRHSIDSKRPDSNQYPIQPGSTP
jgi:hypothetical protein